MLPKKAFRAHGDCRKSPNGHSTGTRTPKNSAPDTSACFHLLQRGDPRPHQVQHKRGYQDQQRKSGRNELLHFVHHRAQLRLSPERAAESKATPARKRYRFALTMVAAQRSPVAREAIASTIGVRIQIDR